ncbi:MAG TPA: histidine--tRNA ligase [Coriobacteriia bacterium]
MNARAPKGTADMLPDVARAWEYVVRVSQDLFARYGYLPIYTPLFEHTEVFTRGIGEATDIVSKEMYTFEDKGGRSLTLRPEGTASVVRAALEHNLTANGASAKLYYVGPMFRYERPQKGRMRQFWQIGAELLGAAEPTADAELITLMWRFFEECGIPAENMRMLLNSMGDENCRPAYRDKVATYIRSHSSNLCEECNRRADTNPLRAFDCKNPACKEIMSGAPLLRDELCDECREHYSAVKALLDELHIPYIEDPSLVRGLDYYTRTVFEVQVHEGLGSQNAIGGGGRYDRLMEEYGGPVTPSLGFALGFERMVLAMQAAGALEETAARTDAFVALAEPTARAQAFALVSALRDAGLSAEMDHQGKSLKAQMKAADRLSASFALILGADELAAGEATLRDMNTKAERRVTLSEAADEVAHSLGSATGA